MERQKKEQITSAKIKEKLEQMKDLIGTVEYERL
jgi:hypothetical protein